MKLSIVLLFLSVDFPYSYSVDRDTVKKFVNNLGAAFKPEFHAEQIFNFMQEQINKTIKMKDEQFNKTIKMKDEQFNKTIKMKDEQFNKTIKKKNDEIEFHLFISTTCWLREKFNKMYEDLVNNFVPSTAKIVVPSLEVTGQPYNTSDETWLYKSYRKWIALLNFNSNNHQLAKCLTESLMKKKYAPSQMAWSVPKIWRFYNRYSHPDDSPSVVGFRKYMTIRNFAITGKTPNKKTLLINTETELKIYNMIRYQRKTFLDVLEARNTWYITKEDCDMINIVMVCTEEPELECRPFKNSPKLVVPLSIPCDQPVYNEECHIYV